MRHRMESELEAAHARCEWHVTGGEVERRLSVCRHCPEGGEFLRHGCPVWPQARAYVAHLISEGVPCEWWAV